MQADRKDGRSGIPNCVAFTLPEGGYDLNPAPLGFRAEFADVLHDVASQGTLRTGFGSKVAAPRPRRDERIGLSPGEASTPSGEAVQARAEPSCRWNGRPASSSPSGSPPTARFRTPWSTASFRRPDQRNRPLHSNLESTPLPGASKRVTLVRCGGKLPNRTPRTGLAQHTRTQGSSI